MLEGGLPWGEAVHAPMPVFLAEYTLHDSHWIGMYSQPNLETVVALQWDTFWDKDKVPFPEPWDHWSALLLVRFERVYRTTTTYAPRSSEREWSFSTGISDADSEPVSPSERESLLETALNQPRRWDESDAEYLLDETLHRTTFEPTYGAFVELWHGGDTHFLHMSNRGEVLALPDPTGA